MGLKLGNTLDANSNKITNLSPGVAATDAANYGQVAAIETGWNGNTTILSADGTGDYTTLAAAIAFVNTQTPSSALGWTILVTPGEYEIVHGTDLPDYVTLEAISGGKSFTGQGGAIVRFWSDIGNTAAYTLSLGTNCYLKGVRIDAYEDNPPLSDYALIKARGIDPTQLRVIEDCALYVAYTSNTQVVSILDLAFQSIVNNCILEMSHNGANLARAAIINHVSFTSFFLNNVFINSGAGTYPNHWLLVDGTTGELVTENTVFDAGATVSEVLVNAGGTWQNHEAGYWNASGAGTNSRNFFQATEAEAGMAEIATLVETNAGASDSVVLTPLKLAGATGVVQTGDVDQSILGKKEITGKLTITSTVAAMVLPRMTSAQRTALPEIGDSLPAGSILYNDENDTIEYYDGAAWQVIAIV